ncbi:MAG: UbiA-like protein EboC [Chitinophagaceae bacterium]
MKKTTGYLRLMRPANIVTSVADVLAGIAISGLFTEPVFDKDNLLTIVWLCMATVGLYGGGVVFNDVFDAGLDSVERPERPIPSGLVSVREATKLGTFLLAGGILAAFLSNRWSGLISVLIAFSALIYNKWGKHQLILGPVNMGLCRGLNLLLGISILPMALNSWWGLAFVPILYIASITMISRGEVHGGSRALLYIACFLYSLVIGFILYFSFKQDNSLFSLVFLLPFTWMIFTPLIRAIRDPVGRNIGKAVKAGVLALILMNAAWAAAFGAIYPAILIVLLLPVSLKLGKLFAVT